MNDFNQLTQTQKDALRSLNDVLNKYDIRIDSDDPYCGVEITIGNFACGIDEVSKYVEKIDNDNLN